MYRFNEIENDIHALCAEDLLNEIKKAEDELHASLTEWLQGLETDVTGDACSSIEDILSILDTNIANFEQSFINQSLSGTSLYVRLVKQLTENLPDEIEIEQDESRFLSMAEDRAWTSVLKGGKRAVRGIQRAFDSASSFLKKMAASQPGSTREYVQKVPLKRLVQYHFYKNETAATQYSDFWNKVKLQLLADLEQVLIDTVQEENSLQDEEQLKERCTQFTEEKIEQLDVKISQSRKQWLEYSVDLEKKITHAAHRVDTIEHSSRYYRPDLVESMQNDVETMITNRKTRWTEAQQQVTKKLHPLIDFLVYHHDMEARFRKLVHEVNRYAESLLIKPVSTIISSVKKAQDRIKKAESEGDPQLWEHHDELLQAMQNKLLKPLSQALETNRFEQLLDQYIEQALLRTTKLREEIELYYGARWEDFPPSYEVDALPWQAIVTRRLNEELLNVLRQSKKDVRKKLEAYYTEFQEVYDVIKVNLETSSGAEDESEKESAEEVAIEGLERSISKLEADLEPIREDYATLEETLQNQVNEFEQQLLSLLTAKGASDFQLQDTSYRVRKTTSGLKNKVEAKSERLQDKLELFYRFSWGKVRKWYQQVSRFLGSKPKSFSRSKKLILPPTFRKPISGYRSCHLCIASYSAGRLHWNASFLWLRMRVLASWPKRTRCGTKSLELPAPSLAKRERAKPRS
ncbi:MAG: hypothetical protein U5K69_05620 [Balneolaceae bacterium]|nr:hypothetical protein [Balneolaceae bacterium]